jgi:hypothetical protein
MPQQARGVRASVPRIGKPWHKVKVCLICVQASRQSEAAMEPIRRHFVGVALAMATVLLAGTAAAQPRWGGGVHFGWGPPPFHHPHHYPPPYYGAPHYPPPAPVASEGCYAGAYVCPLEGPARVGMPCSCPTGQGQAWGRAR